MTQERLLELAERFQKKADRAFDTFQETGIGRYDSERCRNEDIADALRMAASAADDHLRMVDYKIQLANLANKAQAVRLATTDEEKQKAVDSLVSEAYAIGKLGGLIREIG